MSPLCGACADEIGPAFSHGVCSSCGTETVLTGPPPVSEPVTVPRPSVMPRLATEPPRWSRLWPLRSKR